VHGTRLVLSLSDHRQATHGMYESVRGEFRGRIGVRCVGFRGRIDVRCVGFRGRIGVRCVAVRCVNAWSQVAWSHGHVESGRVGKQVDAWGRVGTRGDTWGRVGTRVIAVRRGLWLHDLAGHEDRGAWCAGDVEGRTHGWLGGWMGGVHTCGLPTLSVRACRPVWYRPRGASTGYRPHGTVPTLWRVIGPELRRHRPANRMACFNRQTPPATRPKPTRYATVRPQARVIFSKRHVAHCLVRHGLAQHPAHRETFDESQ
jgi:hypothetical protein